MVLVAFIDSAAALLGIRHPWLHSASDILLHGTIWAAFLGASFATRGRRHLAIDALGRLLPDRARRVVVAIASTLGAVVAFLLARGIYEALLAQVASSGEAARLLVERGIVRGGVDRSYEFQFVIPAGFLLIAARLLLHSFHEWLAALRRLGPDAEPEVHALDPELTRVPPISRAGPAEIGIALAALLGLLALARGSTVMGPLAFGVVLTALNMARIASLYFIGAGAPSVFDAAHEELFPLMLIGIACACFAVWAHWVHGALGGARAHAAL